MKKNNLIYSFLLIETMKPQHNNFYDSEKWKKIRDSVLKRDKHIDQVAKRYSLIPKEANLVHHIFPRDIFPQYQFEKWNLISVSTHTHAMLHNRNDNKLTAKGYELLKRTALKNNIDLTLLTEELKQCVSDYKN